MANLVSLAGYQSSADFLIGSNDLDAAIRKGKSCGMEDEELRQLFDLLLEE